MMRFMSVILACRQRQTRLSPFSILDRCPASMPVRRDSSGTNAGQSLSDGQVPTIHDNKDGTSAHGAVTATVAEQVERAPEMSPNPHHRTTEQRTGTRS